MYFSIFLRSNTLVGMGSYFSFNRCHSGHFFQQTPHYKPQLPHYRAHSVYAGKYWAGA